MTTATAVCKAALLTFAACLFLASCGAVPESPTDTRSFRSAFGFDDKGPWVVLRRPNSIWTLGTVLEIDDRGSEDLGNVLNLNCFPIDKWIVETGEASHSAYNSRIDYGLSLSATLGLPKGELVKAGIKVGGDVEEGQSSQHKTVFTIEKAEEQRVDYVLLESFIEENYSEMTSSFKRNLVMQNRYIVDKVYRVKKGSLEVVDNGGFKINLSTPKFKAIADAAAAAGFQIGSGGTITISENSPPTTFAVRAIRFDDILKHIGVQTMGLKAPSFEQAMRKENLSAPYQ